MIRRLIGALAALMLGLMLALAPVSTASAETCILGVCYGGRVLHVEDAGHDPSIIVFCNYADAFTNGEPDPDWSKEKYVAEGTSSRADCGDDTDVIYVRSGEEISCRNMNTLLSRKYDATGPHKINDLDMLNCTVQLD